MENLRTKLADIDFSNHKLEIKEDKLTTIHSLIHPEYDVMFRVNFINVMDRLLITGDFGNYVFNRSFYPNEENYVSVSYWNQKLIGEAHELEFNEIVKDLEEALDKYVENKMEEEPDEDCEDKDEYIMMNSDDVMDYYEKCIELAENRDDSYKFFAYNDYPDDLAEDYGDVVIHEKTLERLRIVYDAFNEICRRVQQEKIDGLLEKK